jgi:hypothetical protein
MVVTEVMVDRVDTGGFVVILGKVLDCKMHNSF